MAHQILLVQNDSEQKINFVWPYVLRRFSIYPYERQTWPWPKLKNLLLKTTSFFQKKKETLITFNGSLKTQLRVALEIFTN